MHEKEPGAVAGVVNLQLLLAPDPEVDAEDCERLTRQLRAEIADLDVESVGLAAGGAAPEGSKGVDSATLGGIIVALSTSGGVFTMLVQTLRDWLGRHGRQQHRISINIDGDTIELEHASAEQQQALVEAYVRRYSAG